MNEQPSTLTRDGLIQAALQGKDKAIAAYDDMLWKIRTGYAAVLYGTFTLVVSLGDKKNWPLPFTRVGLVAVTLICGFTCCAAALDFSILSAKFRVIQAKEELMDLALSLASGEAIEKWSGTPLQTLLHNSGEDRSEIRWERRTSVWPIVLLYVGTLRLACL